MNVNDAYPGKRVNHMDFGNGIVNDVKTFENEHDMVVAMFGDTERAVFAYELQSR